MCQMKPENIKTGEVELWTKGIKSLGLLANDLRLLQTISLVYIVLKFFQEHLVCSQNNHLRWLEVFPCGQLIA